MTKMSVYLFLIATQVFAVEPPKVATPSSDQAAQELMTSLETEKAVNLALDSSGFYYRTIPKESNPDLQKKINILYQEAEKKYELQRPELKAKTLANIKELYKKQFTAAELQYLVVLSKYPVFKKLKQFLESEAYTDVINYPTYLQRPAVAELKKQVKDLKSASAIKK